MSNCVSSRNPLLPRGFFFFWVTHSYILLLFFFPSLILSFSPACAHNFVMMMASSMGIVMSLVAPVALAHEIASSSLLGSAGFCHSPVLRSFPLLSSPICSPDTLTTRYQASDAHSPSNQAWTRASSCTANGTEEYCVFISSTFANGRGLGVVTSPERANYIANLPAFTDQHALENENAEKSDDLLPYEFVHVPGKDMGVVAKRPIYRGDHLMTFTPALVLDYGAMENLPEPDIHRLQTEAIDQLPSDLRNRFLNLSTHSGASSHTERIDKILRTNAFDVEISDDNEFGLYVVFPESLSPHPPNFNTEHRENGWMIGLFH